MIAAMEIVTWNVNSIRARLPRFLPWLEAHRPEVVCLQETKCEDDKFPREPIEDLGYTIAIDGQRTYNGVAILSRVGLEDVSTGFEGNPDPEQKRAIGATVGGDTRVLNLYVVNGQAVGSEKFDFKLAWLEALSRHFEAAYEMNEKVVVVGDFNITFDDRDVYDADAWREKILCSTPEREALARFMQPGLVDALRHFHEEQGPYTWWDFRTRGFRRDRGLRIDHVLVWPPALEVCTGVRVDREARDGEKPSDHAPVIASFD